MLCFNNEKFSNVRAFPSHLESSSPIEGKCVARVDGFTDGHIYGSDDHQQQHIHSGCRWHLRCVGERCVAHNQHALRSSLSLANVCNDDCNDNQAATLTTSSHNRATENTSKTTYSSMKYPPRPGGTNIDAADGLSHICKDSRQRRKSPRPCICLVLLLRVVVAILGFHRSPLHAPSQQRHLRRPKYRPM